MTRLAGRRDDRPETDEMSDETFWRSVARLPKQQARVVALFYVDDCSVEQIASMLGCSTGTVKTHLSRARATLHATLRADEPREGGTR